MQGRIVLGVLLVVLGIGALLDVAGVWEFGEVAGTWWPLLLIGVGLAQFVGRSGHTFGATVLLVIGLWFLLRNLDVIEPAWGRYVWPLAILLVGVAILTGVLRRPRRKNKAAVAEATVSRTAVFGGFEERVVADRFERAELTAVFGGGELDLREAHFAQDATVDALAAFGGIDVLVPKGTRVRIQGTPLFGGISNKVEASAEGPMLVVKGTALFGGISVKDQK